MKKVFLGILLLPFVPLIIILDPGLLHKEIWDRLSKFDVAMRLIYVPVALVAGGLFPVIIANYGYREILLYFILLITIVGVVNDLRNYSIFKKQNFWTELICLKVFNIMMYVVAFDLLFQSGLIEVVKEVMIFRENEYSIVMPIAVMFAVFLSFHLLLSQIPRSYEYMLPELKKFFGLSDFRNKIKNMVLFIVFCIMIFGVIYYLVNAVYRFNGFNLANVNIFECFIYSFSIFFSSPISELKAASLFLRILTGVESLMSYILLVVFINHLFIKNIEPDI